jgi:cytochrome c-type biogenesis protein CcmH/NrfG
VEENQEIRARFFYTAAVLCRDRLDRADQAVDLFNMALDCAPGQLKAFQAIDRILTQQKEWQGLERNYMQMIGRLPNEGAEPLRGMLWHNLGEVYRTRLRQLSDAIAAFEIASRLEPEHQQRHEILAELYTLSGPEHAAKAIEEHRTLVARDPGRMISYHALQQLHLRIGDHDGAWCISGALALLKQATDEERQLFERYRRPSPRRARGASTMPCGISASCTRGRTRESTHCW